MTSMKQWYQAAVFSLGLLAAGCEKEKSKEVPSFVEGTVLEDRMYSYPAVGETYVLKVRVEEPSFEGTQISRTYTLLLRNSSAFETTPIEVLNEAISPGTKVIFHYRKDDGGREYPIDGFGSMTASKLEVLRPFEDSRAVLAGLEGKAKEEYEVQLKMEQAQARREAAEIYKNVQQPKE